jgi:hypothetical protein
MNGKTEQAQREIAEIKAASTLHPQSGAWAFFMREILELPTKMTPVVFQAIRLENWKFASNPREVLRADALRAHELAWDRQPAGMAATASGRY